MRYWDSGLGILTLELGYREILRGSSRQEKVMEGRIKSFNTWATAVEAAQESLWQSWVSDLSVPTLESWDDDLNSPKLDFGESDLRVRTPEWWDSILRVPGPYRKVLTRERRVLGQYRRVPRPYLRITTLE